MSNNQADKHINCETRRIENIEDNSAALSKVGHANVTRGISIWRNRTEAMETCGACPGGGCVEGLCNLGRNGNLSLIEVT